MYLVAGMTLYWNYCRYLLSRTVTNERVVLIHTICNALEFFAELAIIAIFYEKTKTPTSIAVEELKSEQSDVLRQ